MRGKGSSIVVTVSLAILLMLGMLSPVSQSTLDGGEETTGISAAWANNRFPIENGKAIPQELLTAEVKKLTASDGAAGDVFGTAASLSGSTLVVGACQDISGSAYVYERDLGGAENWGERTKLTPSDGANNDNFGWSVSISGDTVVIGAFFDDVGANPDQGSAYVYERDYGGPDNWGEVTKLTASDGAGNDRFGWSVSIFGDTIVAGAYGDQIGANAAQGSAYVFERDLGGADNWGERKKLTAPDGLANDYFGSSVSVYGDTLVIGAFGDDIGANNDQGSAYLLERNLGGANNWGQVTKVTASDGGTFDFLGWSASISIDTIVVGAYFATVGPSSFQGAAYVFERDYGGPDNWGEAAKLTASDGESLDYFGFSVSINVDTIVAGAYYDDVGANGDQGSACVFGRNEGGAENWGQVTNLTGSDSTANDHFGSSVTINGDTIVVGANTDDIGANVDQGSAYIIKLSSSYILSLNEGWNLISLPLIQPDTSIDMVLSSINGKWDYIQVYDANPTVTTEVFNGTVYGPAGGGEMGPFYLDSGNIVNCSLYWYDPFGGDWYNMVEGVEYTLDYSTGEVNISGWGGPLGPGEYIKGFYNYSITPDHWKTNATFKPDQLNDLKLLDHKMGFWINITESNVNLTVYGNVSTSTSISLYAGWNLVGYPSLTEKTISESLVGTGYDKSVEGFNATAPYRITTLADSYMMKPGEGYWVHVPADTVWAVDW
ncbi:MAG: FG-GAP repeat protein [Thermoplasmata archaeon]|nr:FG-GAP repeat protein [Thermoplasmata archaeon]